MFPLPWISTHSPLRPEIPTASTVLAAICRLFRRTPSCPSKRFDQAVGEFMPATPEQGMKVLRKLVRPSAEKEAASWGSQRSTGTLTDSFPSCCIVSQSTWRKRWRRRFLIDSRDPKIHLWAKISSKIPRKASIKKLSNEWRLLERSALVGMARDAVMERPAALPNGWTKSKGACARKNPLPKESVGLLNTWIFNDSSRYFCIRAITRSGKGENMGPTAVVETCCRPFQATVQSAIWDDSAWSG